MSDGPLLVLACRRLSKAFGETVAVRDVTLGIDAREVVALTGPSGSGKTTLLQCLAGVLLPDEGTVTCAGTEVSALDESKRAVFRRRHFGFLFQFGMLVPELTMVENAALPLLLDGAKPRNARRRAQELLDELGVGALSRRVPGEVSGGQAQRVALARALVHEPAVVFADEPTGALDSTASATVMDLLVRVAHDRGAAVVCVTHDEATAAYAQRSLSIEDGAVAWPASASLTSMR